jgi:hypothetical protein
MPDEVKVILDLSEDVQTLLEQQEINLYQELQREVPSLRLEVQQDPGSPAGSRDMTTVILAGATLVSALSPIILRILNQITPSHRSEIWEVEEIETRQPDGTITLHRKRVHSHHEHRPSESEQTRLTSPDREGSSPQK